MKKQQEYIKKTEAYIDKYRAGIKSKMARGRQSQLNRIETSRGTCYFTSFTIFVPPAAMSADKVLELDQHHLRIWWQKVVLLMISLLLFDVVVNP